MRLVQLMIPAGAEKTIRETLDERDIEYVMTDETSGREYTAVVYFPLPTAAVEPVLDALQEQGIEEDAYTVVVDAETVISRKFEALREEYEQGDVEEERISRQELRTQAEELTPTFSIYLTLTIISALVATSGLLLDSPAVVVGSMVIAPLIGPALGASIGTVLDDSELFTTGVKYQAIGVVASIGSAAIFAWSVRMLNIVPPGMELSTVDEIAERLAPDMLSLVIALGAGVAGILSISTGTSVALVGVMIAAALIPPAAAAGIAVAFGNPPAAIGSTVLVFVNVLSVNLAGLLTLWYAGYRPENLFDLSETQRHLRRRLAALALVVLLLSAFLGAITYGNYKTGTFEQNAREETERILDEEYEELSLLSIEVELNDDYPFRGPERVIVTIGTPPGESYPELARLLHERINQHSDQEVSVEVRFVDIVQE